MLRSAAVKKKEEEKKKKKKKEQQQQQRKLNESFVCVMMSLLFCIALKTAWLTASVLMVVVIRLCYPIPFNN